MQKEHRISFNRETGKPVIEETGRVWQQEPQGFIERLTCPDEAMPILRTYKDCEDALLAFSALGDYAGIILLFQQLPRTLTVSEAAGIWFIGAQLLATDKKLDAVTMDDLAEDDGVWSSGLCLDDPSTGD